MAPPPTRPKIKYKRPKTGGVKGLQSLTLIPDSDVQRLHKSLFDIVKANVPRVREVLSGTRQWNPQQTKLYLSLLDKVVPDLKQSHDTLNLNLSVDEMTPEQLRAIAAGELHRMNAAAEASGPDDLLLQASSSFTTDIMEPALEPADHDHSDAAASSPAPAVDPASA